MILAANWATHESQNRPKINKKTIQKSTEKSRRFLRYFCSVFGWLWGCFWDPGPSKMSVSCKRGAHFQKIVFFMLGLTFCWFCDVLGCFGDSFWEPKWRQNGFKLWSKNQSFFIEFRSHSGSTLATKMTPQSSPKHHKINKKSAQAWKIRFFENEHPAFTRH